MRTEKLKWYIAMVSCLCNLNFMLLAQNLNLISAPVNVNAISTKIYNTGDLFWHGWDDHSKFFVPFQGKASPYSIFSSNLLLLINNDKEGIKLAGEIYTPKFKPGPLYDQHFIPDSLHLTSFNKIWSVTDLDINLHREDFQADGIIDQRQENIYAWPGKGNPHFAEYNGFELADPGYELADFKDFNGDGIYNPDFGDYPQYRITGSSQLPAILHYTVFHHLDGDFRAEFGLHVWAWDCPDNRLLHSSLFTSVRVVNQSAYDWQNTRLCMFFDSDIGCWEDDYIGSIPLLNASFAYNVDPQDGQNGKCMVKTDESYNFDPPAQSLIFLNRSMDFLTFCSLNDELTLASCPSTDSQYYHLLNGRWGRGWPMTNRNTDEPALIVYPDPPFRPGSWWQGIDHWSWPEESESIFQTTAVHLLEVGHFMDLDMAFVYHAIPGLGHEGNIELMYEDLEELKKMYDRKFDFNCPDKDCKNICVWPGDSNDDGIVDYLDAVPIFRSLGDTGTIRKDVFRWRPQPSEDWLLDILGAKNSKFSDADGNGMVELKDLSFILHYLNHKHDKYKPSQKNCNISNQISLRDLGGVPYLSTAKNYQLICNSPIEKFQGISFEIKTDLTIVDSIRFVATSDLMGTQANFQVFNTRQDGQKSLFYVHFNKNLDNVVPSSNTWGHINIRRRPGIPLEAEFIDLYLCDVRIYLTDGTFMDLGGQSIRIALRPPTVNLNLQNDNLNFYPNPTDHILYFDEDDDISFIQIYDARGVFIKSIDMKKEKFILLDGLISGLYFMEILTSNAAIYRDKFMIIR